MLSLAACGPSMNSLQTQSARGSKILDGAPVNERTSPASRSVVLLEMVNRSRSPIGYCSGTLIDKNIILTAGHCFDITRTPDLAGFNILFVNSLEKKSPANTRRGVSYSLNSRYNSQKVYEHDVAVAYFRGDIPDGFSTVQIDTDTKANYSSHLVYVYGYGHTSDQGRFDGNSSQRFGVLHKGLMTIDNSYTRYGDRYLTSMASESFLCQGDSGGPQFHHEKGLLKQIGINSASLAVRRLPNGKFSCYAQGQATKVAPLANWIRREAQAMKYKYN